ncbi:EAL domain-containing protein [Dactylosporangium sp. CA-092794]|uniref:EAL domain-containing protein n=1 Tax=Dactylosporangium sp. CA-092794 TaxID=3239929 RepID=UPI003D917609
MAESSRRWTLWSRSGYRGPSDLSPHHTGFASPPPADAPPVPAPAAPGSFSALVAPATAVPATVPATVPAMSAQPAMRPAVRAAAAGASLIDQIIDARAVQMQFQAVHDADSAQVVAFEALARGPAGPLHSPLQLLSAARAVGRLGELDWVCRTAAFRAMLDAGLPSSVSLLVNVESDSLIEPCPPDLLPIVAEAERKLRVFVDLSGRAVSRYPCQALETARRARAANWGVAINDVEFSAGGAALLPTLEPDVVKLNHHLIASGLPQANAALLAAIGEAERTGAAVLVEQVETTDAAMVARAAGARYQQGHLFGTPGGLPAHLPQPVAPLPLLHEDGAPTAATPWEILVERGARSIAEVGQAGLDHLIMATATQVTGGDQPPVAALVTPAGAEFEPARQAMFAMLLERCPLIIALGQHVAAWNDWRVRAADLTPGHPLTDETCFALLSPSVAVVVAARQRQAHRGTPEVWDVAVSQSPDRCRAVMRQLLATVDTLAGGVHSYW